MCVMPHDSGTSLSYSLALLQCSSLIQNLYMYASSWPHYTRSCPPNNRAHMYSCCNFSYRYYRRCVELFNVQCWVITAKASLIKNGVIQMNNSLKPPHAGWGFRHILLDKRICKLYPGSVLIRVETSPMDIIGGALCCESLRPNKRT